ncbi:DgyrCDS3881 [Dimorphilus gyrociliatus]|uniref:DgyrCDS3881 n=1 Tax=Dimorphilus gyrociliatus TaxID=2664684 RepID=A0A7I8VFA2_9ANNE|nr:DgyrCDS3881 [Dimorphilus gyrociliatus]
MASCIYKDKIKVSVRIAHIHSKNNENVDTITSKLNTSTNSILVKNPKDDKKEVKIFNFDNVFDHLTSQEEIFNTCAQSVIENVINGYNGAIISYGVSGSGRSYTMNGDGDNIGDFGIIPRSITYIFDLIKERNNSEKYSVKVSYYRHNTAFDEIEDLLNDDPNQIVKIKESKELGTYIQNLSTVPTKNSNEMYEYFIKGKNKFTREFTSFFTVTIDSIKTTKSDDSSIKNSTRTGRPGIVKIHINVVINILRKLNTLVNH